MERWGPLRAGSVLNLSGTLWAVTGRLRRCAGKKIKWKDAERCGKTWNEPDVEIVKLSGGRDGRSVLHELHEFTLDLTERFKHPKVTRILINVRLAWCLIPGRWRPQIDVWLAGGSVCSTLEPLHRYKPHKHWVILVSEPLQKRYSRHEVAIFTA